MCVCESVCVAKVHVTQNDHTVLMLSLELLEMKETEKETSHGQAERESADGFV